MRCGDRVSVVQVDNDLAHLASQLLELEDLARSFRLAGLHGLLHGIMGQQVLWTDTTGLCSVRKTNAKHKAAELLYLGLSNVSSSAKNFPRRTDVTHPFP